MTETHSNKASSAPEKHETPETTPVAPPKNPVATARIGKLKLAFLYVLIGGLAGSAIIAVTALLLGQFNSAMSRSLLTIFIFFTHSLLILAVLWADKFNQVGRLILPTAVVVLTLANMVTTTLGTWDIISTETAWRALGLYFLVLGAVFVVTATLQLRIAQQAVQTGIYATVGFIVATVLAIAPWVLDLADRFDPLYYRIIAALSILMTTTFLITVILRGIALARNQQLHATKPKAERTPGGLLAVYISLGVITSIVWCAGLSGLLVSGVESNNPYERSAPSYQDDDYDYDSYESSRDRTNNRYY